MIQYGLIGVPSSDASASCTSDAGWLQPPAASGCHSASRLRIAAPRSCSASAAADASSLAMATSARWTVKRGSEDGCSRAAGSPPAFSAVCGASRSAASRAAASGAFCTSRCSTRVWRAPSGPRTESAGTKLHIARGGASGHLLRVLQA
eukprot:scaffold80376_cov26-Tisochrysis_lutea.AAC.1